ncbi:MAG: Crp/Fnr family transcriptional regulator [Pedobacter sp.]|nr:MAG: Crp/Fnr family transcriptional regulator [Pedobacter sp.]
MPVNKLITALGLVHPLSKDYQHFLEKEAIIQKKIFKKDDILLMPGLDTKRFINILTGAVKAYWLDTDNQEHTFIFLESGGFAVLPDNVCIGQRNEDLYIKALMDTEVLILSAEQMADICTRFAEAKLQVKKIDEQLIALRDKHLLMLMLKERDRYAYFVRDFTMCISCCCLKGSFASL